MVEEIEETVLWLERLADSEIFSREHLKELQVEANEPLAIFVTSRLTAKGIAPNSEIRSSVNFSSARHNQGSNLSFADGHAERWHWAVPKTPAYAGQGIASGEMPDFRRLQSAMKVWSDN